MTEQQDKELLTAFESPDISREELIGRIATFISSKTVLFAHTTNALANSPFNSLQDRAMIAGDLVRLLYTPDQVENIVQYLSLVIVEIRNPTPINKPTKTINDFTN